VLTHHRDSEDSAPAQYPPEQPDADQLDDDETKYGAEEAEMQAALEQELETIENGTTKQDGDAEMAGTEEAATKTVEDDEASEAGSEDLEQESSDDDEGDEEEEEEAEDVEMGDGEEKVTNGKPEVTA
jgi:histone chaperone ASF1